MVVFVKRTKLKFTTTLHRLAPSPNTGPAVEPAKLLEDDISTDISALATCIREGLCFHVHSTCGTSWTANLGEKKSEV
jgi:hypothetical protein